MIFEIFLRMIIVSLHYVKQLLFLTLCSIYSLLSCIIRIEKHLNVCQSHSDEQNDVNFMFAATVGLCLHHLLF